jgi:hypothetical protein
MGTSRVLAVISGKDVMNFPIFAQRTRKDGAASVGLGQRVGQYSALLECLGTGEHARLSIMEPKVTPEIRAAQTP